MRTFFRKTAALLVGLALGAGSFPHLGMMSPGVAQAQYSVNVVGGPGSQAARVSAAADQLVAELQQSLVTKEFHYDRIAFLIAKTALQQVVQTTVDWINSGFQGSPAYVTDLEQHMLETADAVAGEFIYGTEIGFLCSPFQLNVQIALESYINQRDFRYAQCTLSGIVGNVDSFLSGNFAAGGWPGLLSMALNPANTQHGATIMAKIELQNRILAAQGQQSIELDWGNGFLSWRNCEGIPMHARGPNDENCPIATPGATIQDALTINLSTGPEALIEADEINEVISALFGQLLTETFQGVGGLFGLSQTGASGSSYTSQLGSATPGSGQPGSGGTDPATSLVGPAIADERAYQAIWRDVSERATDVVAAANAGGTCNDSIASSASDIRTDANDAISGSLTTEALLQGMEFRYEAADPEEQLIIIDEFEALRTSGDLNDSISNIQTGFDAEADISTLDNLSQNIQDCTPSQTASPVGAQR